MHDPDLTPRSWVWHFPSRFYIDFRKRQDAYGCVNISGISRYLAAEGPIAAPELGRESFIAIQAADSLKCCAGIAASAADVHEFIEAAMDYTGSFSYNLEARASFGSRDSRTGLAKELEKYQITLVPAVHECRSEARSVLYSPRTRFLYIFPAAHPEEYRRPEELQKPTVIVAGQIRRC